DGGEAAGAVGEGDGRADVDAAEAVAVGHAEGLVGVEMGGDSAQAAAGHRVLAGVDDGDAPVQWLVAAEVFDAVAAEIEAHVRAVKRGIGEKLRVQVAL